MSAVCADLACDRVCVGISIKNSYKPAVRAIFYQRNTKPTKDTLGATNVHAKQGGNLTILSSIH